MLIFDIETDGLMPAVSKIHCLVTLDTDTGIARRYRGADIAAGVDAVLSAPAICGHNIIGYDLPVIAKLYGRAPVGLVRDTIVMARLIYTDIDEHDARLIARGSLPKQLRGRHSLEAWGHRLGVHKGDFKGPWDTWTQEMEDYCEQDVRVTAALWDKLCSKQYAETSIELEHRVAAIIHLQEERGFAFDEQAAAALYSKLVKRRLELESELQKVFKPWFAPGATFTPKGNNSKHGYTAGVPFCKVAYTQFNAGSRDHIANRLQARGWKPKAFTENGKPKVDETVLAGLVFPEAKLLSEYFLVEKRVGQLAEGKEAWMKAVKNGRIHGRVTTNGTVTGRMSHSRPNIGQVPATYSPYGKECRALFRASPGFVLVGCDAEGLELRALAHYMAAWDGGAYANTVVNGKKEDGSDAHSVNTRALEIQSRDTAKTFLYALIYGAGDVKLGLIVTENDPNPPRSERKLKQIGAAARARLMKNLPAFGELVARVKAAAKSRGVLRGLDGRLLHVRSEHAALNTLLQSAGAVVMKQALVLFDGSARKLWTYGSDYAPVANIHDEFQIEARPTVADEVGKLAALSIRRAGEHFNFRCRLDGSYSIGANWAETH